MVKFKHHEEEKLPKDIISTFDIGKPSELKSLFERYKNMPPIWWSLFPPIDLLPNENYIEWCHRHKKIAIKERINWLRGMNKIEHTFGWGAMNVDRKDDGTNLKNKALDLKIKECIRVAGGRDVLEEIFSDEALEFRYYGRGRSKKKIREYKKAMG